MSSTFSIALSALQAESEAINTTGNNLANMNTSGFKGSDVAFKDLFGESLGANNSFQVGLGVNVPISQTIFTQGPIQSSTSPYAAAISGNGFFVLKGAQNQQLFTRDGNFKVASDGTLQTLTGENVQGWTATNSGVNTSGLPGNITLPAGLVLPPSVTQNVNMTGNLDASGAVGTNFTQPVSVVDSLGNQHTVTFSFTKTSGNQWQYQASLPSSDVSSPASANLASGTLTFDATGNLTAPTPNSVTLTLNNLSDGASSGQNINWSLFDSNGNGQITAFAQSSAMNAQPDGSVASQLSGIAIQNGGQIVATFNNKQQKVLGQLALAAIQNPDTLSNVGNNNFAATAQTGTPSIGLPQTGSRGQIEGGALESSNVDMATQLTNLIVYQSAYQAASRVITTANQMTQDLLQVIH